MISVAALLALSQATELCGPGAKALCLLRSFGQTQRCSDNAVLAHLGAGLAPPPTTTKGTLLPAAFLAYFTQEMFFKTSEGGGLHSLTLLNVSSMYDFFSLWL